MYAGSIKLQDWGVEHGECSPQGQGQIWRRPERSISH